MSKSAQRSPRVRPRKKSLAAKADRHELYELSVQDPETDVDSLASLFRRFRKREALSLREDFCGTAVLSLAWVKSKRGRTAIGIDLDEPTLDWGRTHRLEPAGEELSRRVDLRCANVLDAVGPKVDITAALNFSYFIFHERKELVRYFKAVRRKLVDDGVLILDLVGGWDSMSEETNRREVEGFTYKWKQRRFDPRSHHFVCSIGFEFPDGSKIDDAFVYDWRLWTAPELSDALTEAGFSKVHVMWERIGDDGEGTGSFYEPKRAQNYQSWWTYIVAER